MKKTIIFLSLIFITALFFIGCSGGRQGDAKAESPAQPTIETLLKDACLESAKIKIEYELIVPDSLTAKMALWITETVRAATYSVTTSDYEDTDDLVEQTTKDAKKIFAKEVPITYLSFVPLKGDEYDRRTVKIEDLTPTQRRVFDFLNR